MRAKSCAIVYTATDTPVSVPARFDLGSLLLPSAEGRRLVEQARAAAAELGMSGLGRHR